MEKALGWRPDAVGVCIPVRDEAALLPDLLSALARQHHPGDLRMIVCFMLDGCTDASADIVARIGSGHGLDIMIDSIVRPPMANAGRARRRAMAMGQAALSNCAQAALLTTDADSVPADDWITANLRALEQADVVAGRIERRVAPVDRHRRANAVQTRVESYYDRLFVLRRTLDPVPWEAPRTHHYTSGASLAFRGGAYADIGGFPPRAAAEDATVVDAAHDHGLCVRRDAEVVVRTSSRIHGRAAGGLADHLRDLEHADALPSMAHPADEAWRYVGHAAARNAFAAIKAGASLDPLAERFALTSDQVGEVLGGAPNAEAFAMRVVPGRPSGVRSVKLDEAEKALLGCEQSIMGELQ